MEEAVASWQKAIDLDPAEVEAAYSLATYWRGPGGRPADGAVFLRRGFRALPTSTAGHAERRRAADAIVGLLRDMLEASGEPVALMAAWSAGAVLGKPVINMSSVDLRHVDDFERLTDFVSTANLVGLDLTPELPEEQPTLLQRLLNDDDSSTWSASELPLPTQPARAVRAVGRNAPCPCGSGTKYKRCCGK